MEDNFSLEQNQPCRIVKSLVPKRNRLVFFEVTDKSYHQVREKKLFVDENQNEQILFWKVAEVLNEHQEPRWSINGWLHGPVNHRSDPIEEPAEEMKKPTEYQSIDVRELCEIWKLNSGFQLSFNLLNTIYTWALSV